jgi:uncharacterized protein (DUF885 family)
VSEDQEQAARELAQRFWEGILRLEPTVGTWIGDERFDDRLPDPSEAGRSERETFLRAALEDSTAIEKAGLSQDLRTTLDVLETGARRELDSLRLRMDQIHAVSHMFGPVGLLASLGSLQRADTPERLERYVARLRAFPAFLASTAEVALEGVGSGRTSPALVVDRTIGQVERLLAIEPDASPGMQPVEQGSDEAKSQVAAGLREAVWPAYQAYLEALRTYRPSARDSIGLGDLDEGDVLYASQIVGFTTLDLPAERIHQIGLEQLERIQEERREIARGLGHATAEEALAEYDATGKNRATTREEMLELVRDQVRRSWEAAPAWFGRVPRANCEVRPIEEFQEDDMPGAYYNPPTADGSRPGLYYMNTGSLEGRPLHQTATTSFHEANPGHHFQLSIEQEFEDRLPLRRFGGFLVGDSFVEGWGLYSERLADEMGLFLDEYERLGMLEAQAFRAGRLIVDTGIHALGWDRERAVRQMMDTGATRIDSEIEVDRYIAMAGQALAYMLGKLEIDRWRAERSKAEGSAFDLRAFHDGVLALGSLPLSSLARELGVAPA